MLTLTSQQKLDIIADYMKAIEGKGVPAELVKASVDAILAIPTVDL